MDKIPVTPTAAGYTLVETSQALEQLTAKLKNTSRVAIDTEADSLHHYFEKVCLIQLSFSGENFIIDPLSGLSLSGFFEELAEKELIFQGADYDLRVLKKSFGFRVKKPVFDTMLAAQVLGYEKIGLAALAEKFFGVVMPKTAQKADWSKRPLTERLLTYASDDTKYLEAIAQLMSAELQELKRVEWHRQCCERAVNTVELPDRNADKEAWRIKGSFKLSPAELVYLRQLWMWRDDEARKKDRPVFMIMKNEDLLELTVWRAKNTAASLSEGPAFLKRITGTRLDALKEAFRIAEALPPSQYPAVEKKKGRWEEPPNPEMLEKLLTACKALADELKIQSSFLASRAALTAVIRHRPRSVDEVMTVSGMMRWQAELMIPAITAVLKP